ncbi:M28 family metallopeptidase [Actinomycetes bacterium M1A6_2h]
MKTTKLMSVVGVLALAVACSSSPDEPAPDVTGESLAQAMSADAVVEHLQQLTDIAAAHDGNRAAGTAGYDASVDYVSNKLKEAGFDVDTPEFEFDSFDVTTQTLRFGDRDLVVNALSYSPATPPGGVTARVVGAPADDTPGCEATDYDGLDVTGAVVVVTRGVCPFAQKQQTAADRGAVAVLVANNEDGPLDSATLGSKDDAKIPTGGISRDDGAALLAAPSQVTLVIDSSTTTTKSRNVIAQTKTGSTENVVMAGAHLDSVPEGPGINDNGTGTASVLESALQLGSEPQVTNAVRFAFWGAEELGLVGSTKYVESLDDAGKKAIALYMNFDMVGSNNAGYLVYDGDDSDEVGSPAGPTGSDAIERVFSGQLLLEGEAPDGTDFDGRSDYGPFIEVGIPAGGVFTGADEEKTEAQAAKWGGEAGKTFDPNYHTVNDTLENVDRDALAVNAKAVAYGIGNYAESIEGPNGVPAFADRDAARAPK